VKVECEVQFTELENDEGHSVESVVVTCTRCAHQEESFGVHEGSIRRCLVLLRENCPRNEKNFYVDANE
jgi:hypothetical protein